MTFAGVNLSPPCPTDTITVAAFALRGKRAAQQAITANLNNCFIGPPKWQSWSFPRQKKRNFFATKRNRMVGKELGSAFRSRSSPTSRGLVTVAPRSQKHPGDVS